MAKPNQQKKRFLIEYVIPLIALVILLPYSYAHLVIRPFIGFAYHPISGRIYDVYNRRISGEPLYINDQIDRVNGIPWKTYSSQLNKIPFSGFDVGDQIILVVQRGGSLLPVIWTFPGASPSEIFHRLTYVWWLPYIFWLAGTISLLTVRPKGVHRWLFAAFNYNTALWLAAGLVSGDNTFRASSILHMTSWIGVPLSLHLHWVIPKSLGRLPKPILILYPIAGLLALAEFFYLIPSSTFVLAALTAALGSVVLLFAHGIYQKRSRKLVWILLSLLLIALLPMILLGIARIFNPGAWFGNGIFITLILIPMAYSYALYRKQIANLELRANLLISTYIFIVLLVSILIIGISAFDSFFTPSTQTVSIAGITLAFATLSSIITLFGFQAFRRFLESRILGVPIQTYQLVESYANQITSHLDRNRLVEFITQKILPSLLVRQSALIYIKGGTNLQTVFSYGVPGNQMPAVDEYQGIFDRESVKPTQLVEGVDDSHWPTWVRLVLPFSINSSLRGVWLYGRRDPDDFYSEDDIRILTAIANQTAIALSNIDQADQLHMLYQSNIDRQELERKKLALELHDEVLSNLALMMMRSDHDNPGNRVSTEVDEITNHLRKIVEGLRPAMLNFGLWSAIEELVDSLIDQTSNQVKISLEIPYSDCRFDDQVELHMFRIIQQACHNALQHGNPTQITLHGRIEAQQIYVEINDNGESFDLGDKIDLPLLVNAGHFGLAGMVERANLLGATIKIVPRPGVGTNIRINWVPSPTPA